MGLFHVLAVSFGSSGLIGFISIKAGFNLQFMITIMISFALAFVITTVYGRRIEKRNEIEEKNAANTVNATQDEKVVIATVENGQLLTPVNGIAVSLSTINDPVFSQEIMGKGIAIKPDTEPLYAPADSKVLIAYETGHTFGLKTTNGAEVLLYIGIDTVSMNGKDFTQNVKVGQNVKAGDLLRTFDKAAIKATGLDDTVMMIATNSAGYQEILPLSEETAAKVGEKLLSLSK